MSVALGAAAIEKRGEGWFLDRANHQQLVDEPQHLGLGPIVVPTDRGVRSALLS
jgi:hypothetical protein